MPVVPLTPQEEGDATLSVRRIRGWVRLGNLVATRQALFDTGAPVAILSKEVWAGLHSRGRISWVSNAPDGAQPDSLPTTKVMGRTLPYRLGRMLVHLVDIHIPGRELAGRTVPVLCTEDDPTPTKEDYRIVIGLAGVLNGRSLLIQVSEDGQRWVAAVSEP